MKNRGIAPSLNAPGKPQQPLHPLPRPSMRRPWRRVLRQSQPIACRGRLLSVRPAVHHRPLQPSRLRQSHRLPYLARCRHTPVFNHRSRHSWSSYRLLRSACLLRNWRHAFRVSSHRAHFRHRTCCRFCRLRRLSFQRQRHCLPHGCRATLPRACCRARRSQQRPREVALLIFFRASQQ